MATDPLGFTFEGQVLAFAQHMLGQSDKPLQLKADWPQEAGAVATHHALAVAVMALTAGAPVQLTVRCVDQVLATAEGGTAFALTPVVDAPPIDGPWLDQREQVVGSQLYYFVSQRVVDTCPVGSPEQIAAKRAARAADRRYVERRQDAETRIDGLMAGLRVQLTGHDEALRHLREPTIVGILAAASAAGMSVRITFERG